jgi:hypothetical protein
VVLAQKTFDRTRQLAEHGNAPLARLDQATDSLHSMMVRSPVEICFGTRPGAEVAAFAEHISGAACLSASSVRETGLAVLDQLAPGQLT